MSGGILARLGCAMGAAALIAGCATTWESPRPEASGTNSASDARPTVPPRSTEGATRGCDRADHAPYPAEGVACTADQPPLVEQRVAPEYPDTGREAGISGKVIVAALVCEHGRVVATRVIQSIPMLDAAAIAAVEQWTFKPAVRAAKAVSCWTEVPIVFSLH